MNILLYFYTELFLSGRWKQSKNGHDHPALLIHKHFLFVNLSINNSYTAVFSQNESFWMDNIYVKKNHYKGKIISNEIINFKITLFEKKI